MIARSAAVIAMLAGCGGSLPETRYYQLAPPDTKATGGDQLLVIDAMSADSAYDDDRIVYRTTPYRLDYYQYQRWSSTPGLMVGNYLEQAFETSGRFRAVVREMTPNASVVLSGRVIAIEEVDRSPTEWLGRIKLELVLSDARTSEPLWTSQIDETEPIAKQTPEGLAAALSVAMSRIAARAVPAVADLADRQARVHADPTTTAASVSRVPRAVQHRR